MVDPSGPDDGLQVHLLKRFAVTLVGAVLLVLGVAMMVLPGPGILVIVGALAVLATEYVWAQPLLEKAKSQAEKVQGAAVASPLRAAGTVLFGVRLLALGLRWSSPVTLTCRSGARSLAASSP